MTQEILDGFRLSPPQRRVWTLLRTGARLHSRMALRFAGGFDERALERALAGLVDRHEILRTGFSCLPGMALPVQVIGEAGEACWRSRDLSGITREEQEPAVTVACRFSMSM